MTAAVQVFAIPELLESILLSLPATPTHEELSSIRTILVCQRVCKTWLAVIKNSRHICEFCYLPWSPLSSSTSTSAESSTSPSTTISKPLPTRTQTPTLAPPFRPNPYISNVILSPQSQTHNTTRKDPWLFNGDAIASRYGPPNPDKSSSGYSSPQVWTFFLQISRSQFLQFLRQVDPQEEGWREMYVTNPPFHSAWFTRCGYLLLRRHLMQCRCRRRRTSRACRDCCQVDSSDRPGGFAFVALATSVSCSAASPQMHSCFLSSEAMIPKL